MQLDDKVCYCYHVSMRKLVNFARRKPLPHASQLSRCLDAGTGCGWCIPILQRIHEQVGKGGEFTDDKTTTVLSLTPQEYADARREYLESDKKHGF